MGMKEKQSEVVATELTGISHKRSQVHFDGEGSR